ncbi:hypothetical protein Btru_018787 [Bulinus truncatus]|nr:hypothetical protein Btru_018787 [Bulinus truncatus]
MDSSRIYPTEILQLSMYHAKIRNRDEAKDYMKKYQKGEGSYFIRPNTTNDPSFVSITVSITPDGECCHAKVYIVKQNSAVYYFISEKQKFSSFSDLLRYYAEHRIHCTQNIDNIRLKTPLNTTHQRSGSSRSSFPSVVSRPNMIQVESQTLPRPGVNIPVQPKRGSSLNQTTRSMQGRFPRQQSETGTHQSSYASDMPRSVSESDIQVTTGKYANSGAMQQNVKMMIRCLPPVPLPKVDAPNEDNDFYYTHVDVNKNFFDETYQFLKQTELCECGLRLVDSELPQGWTVHRSQETASKNRIFFQHGDMTTWDMPAELVPLLTIEQIKFLMYLCQDGRCPIPNCLKPRLDREFVKKKPGNVQTLPNNIKLSMETTLPKQLNIEPDVTKAYRVNGFPSNSRNQSESESPIESSQETALKQFNRPLSFDSLPTTLISTKIGSPITGLQENQAALQKRLEDIQQKQLRQELQGIGSFEDGSHLDSNIFYKRKN